MDGKGEGINYTELSEKANDNLFFHQPIFMLKEIFTLLIKSLFCTVNIRKVNTRDY